jgi:hypothetical protein
VRGCCCCCCCWLLVPAKQEQAGARSTSATAAHFGTRVTNHPLQRSQLQVQLCKPCLLWLQQNMG